MVARLCQQGAHGRCADVDCDCPCHPYLRTDRCDECGEPITSDVIQWAGNRFHDICPSWNPEQVEDWVGGARR